MFAPFNVFRYITFRTIYASLTAFLICFLLGPWVIQRLSMMQVGQYIREDGPKEHQKKAGTPTMGGVLINSKAQVLDLSRRPISGLYAAGEVTGGVHGACRLGSCSITECLVFGRIAGRSAARQS